MTSLFTAATDTLNQQKQHSQSFTCNWFRAVRLALNSTQLWAERGVGGTERGRAEASGRGDVSWAGRPAVFSAPLEFSP